MWVDRNDCCQGDAGSGINILPEREKRVRISQRGFLWRHKGRPGDELRLYVDMNRVHFFDTKTEKNIFYHGGQQ